MPPERIASLMKRFPLEKCLPRFSQGTSITWITLYFRSLGKQGFKPARTWRTCVTPYTCLDAKYTHMLL